MGGFSCTNPGQPPRTGPVPAEKRAGNTLSGTTDGNGIIPVRTLGGYKTAPSRTMCPIRTRHIWPAALVCAHRAEVSRRFALSVRFPERSEQFSKKSPQNKKSRISATLGIPLRPASHFTRAPVTRQKVCKVGKMAHVWKSGKSGAKCAKWEIWLAFSSLPFGTHRIAPRCCLSDSAHGAWTSPYGLRSPACSCRRACSPAPYVLFRPG